MVDELIVECLHESLGCTHTCQRQLLDSHLRDACQYVQVTCTEDGCIETVLRKDIGSHSHGCAHRVVSCDACEKTVKASELDVRAALSII